jgi:hypothetical protein
MPRTQSLISLSYVEDTLPDLECRIITMIPWGCNHLGNQLGAGTCCGWWFFHPLLQHEIGLHLPSHLCNGGRPRSCSWCEGGHYIFAGFASLPRSSSCSFPWLSLVTFLNQSCGWNSSVEGYQGLPLKPTSAPCRF